eukprot:5122973-Prymnesium_polylepis.1
MYQHPVPCRDCRLARPHSPYAHPNRGGVGVVLESQLQLGRAYFRRPQCAGVGLLRCPVTGRPAAPYGYAHPRPCYSRTWHVLQLYMYIDMSRCRMAQGRSVNKKKTVFSSNAVCSPEPWRFERR